MPSACEISSVLRDTFRLTRGWIELLGSIPCHDKATLNTWTSFLSCQRAFSISPESLHAHPPTVGALTQSASYCLFRSCPSMGKRPLTCTVDGSAGKSSLYLKRGSPVVKSAFRETNACSFFPCLCRPARYFVHSLVANALQGS